MVDTILIKKLVAKVAVSYFHWREEGFPTEHEYHQHVALLDYYLTTLK